MVKTPFFKTSLVVQQLALHTCIAGGMGSIPGQGTKIPHPLLHSQKKNIHSSLIQNNLKPKIQNKLQKRIFIAA